MKKENRYNYQTFERTIFPGISRDFRLLESLLEDFTYRFNANQQLYLDKFTSKRINRILQITMPKVIRLGYIPDRYINDIYCLYQIAYWDFNTLMSADMSDYGNFSYKTDQHQPLYYNENAYTGTETEVNRETY